MDKIHTLNEIIERMCRHTGCTETEAANFINAVTQEVTTRLKLHQVGIEVPALGTFGIDHQGYVVFMPTQEIAAEVNEPFSLFESVMLEPGVTAEELAGVNDEEVATEKTETQPDIEQKSPAQPIPSPTQPSPAPQPVVESVTDPAAAAITQSDAESVPEPSVEPVRPTEPVKLAEPINHTEPEYIHEAQKPQKAEENDKTDYPSYVGYPDDITASDHRFNPVIAYILGIVTGVILSCILVYFLYPKLMDKSIDDAYGISQEEEYYDSDNTAVDTPEPALTVADDTSSRPSQPETKQTVTPSTAPAAAASSSSASTPSPVQRSSSDGDVVYDKIRPGYFLTKIAKKHYGVQEFWVYIYEENKARIKNPMKLPDGFKVIVPPAEKYGIDANNPASVEKAKNISHELNRRFNQ